MPEKKQRIQAWRERLKTQRNALEVEFFQRKNTAQVLKKQSQLIDKLLKQIWLQATIYKPFSHAGVALIAVGGYGRG